MGHLPRTQRRKLAQIGLIWEARLGPAGFARLVGQFGGPLEVLAATEAELSAPALRLEGQQINAILGLGDRLEAIAQELSELAAGGIGVLCDFEPEYPAILRHIPSAPPVLSVAGRILPLDDPAIAIVGTRSPTQEGLRMARELGKAFAQSDCTVVSGLARGCDTAAHEGALAGGGRTIAVLGSGIRAIHPRENLELARRIAERGAVISELAPETEPSVPFLMARNRLTAALGRGLIVVQSAAQGGAMRTAELARRQGRLVMAVQWPTREERTAGNERLVSGGATSVGGPNQAAGIVAALFVRKQQNLVEGASPPLQLGLFDDGFTGAQDPSQ